MPDTSPGFNEFFETRAGSFSREICILNPLVSGITDGSTVPVREKSGSPIPDLIHGRKGISDEFQAGLPGYPTLIAGL
jgi:hypothetical protein